MKQQQDSNRDPNQANPQGNQQRQQGQDQDGQSSANQGGDRQGQSSPNRSRDQREDQPEGQDRPRQPGSDTSDPGVDQDSDSAGIGKEGQGGQRPQNPRER